jgi:hypothetical protein
MAITTNQQYLQAALAKFDVGEDDIELILVDNSLSGAAAVNVPACKLAMYSSLSNILPLCDVKEGGYSKTWNVEGLKLWYNSLCGELGRPNVLTPKVRNRSYLW